MERIQGKTLYDHFSSVDNGEESYQEGTELKSLIIVKEILIQILQGVAYLHQQGICHLDLTPFNIMIQPEANPKRNNINVKIIDFNCAKQSKIFTKKRNMGEEENHEWTECALIGECGNPHYRAPEMVKGKQYGEKADIWQVGCLLYYIIFGRELFPSTSTTVLYQNIMSFSVDQINTLPKLEF